MPEIRKNVKEVLVDYLCPKCNIGHLRPTGMALYTYPPQFPHKCNNCEYMDTFKDKQYPYIDYEEINTDQNLRLGVDIATANGDYSSTNMGTITGVHFTNNIIPQNNPNIIPNNVDHYVNTIIDNNFIKSNNGNNF